MKVSTSTNKSFSLTIVWILIGILTGAIGYHFLFNHELISIDTKIDLGSLVALLALAISVSVTPFIIDRKLNNQRSYEAMVCGEIEEIVKLLEAVDSLYSETYESSSILFDFKENIQLPFSKGVYSALTDKFQKGAQLSEGDYLNALNQIESTISALKKKRYRIYR